MSAEQNTQNLVYPGSSQRACYLRCSVHSFWFWFGYSDYFKTLHVFLYLFARKKKSIPHDCEEGAHNHGQHGRTWMRWHTKNTEFTGDEGTTATTLRSSYSCATPAGDGGGVGGKCFRFCLCLQPSNCTSIGNKLNSFFKSSVFCPWWQLTRNVPVFIWTQELFHPPFFPCTLEGGKESTAGRGSGSQPRSTHHCTFKHPTLNCC